MSGTVNYFFGNDPAQWRTGITTSSEIVYRNLWPGIDLKFRGDGEVLKYEFHLAPGANPHSIRLAYQGTDRLSLDQEGNLQIHTPRGTLQDSQPVSYQIIAGERVPIYSRYVLDKETYGFQLGSYDSHLPAVIDPGIAYSTYLGSTGSEQGLSIAVDASGSAYITGLTGSSSFPTTTGVFDSTFNGCDSCGDVFVTKLDPSGTALVYSTFLGGSANDQGNGIAIDSQGNAYVTGSTESTDFPTTPGAFDTSDNSGLDAYVTKLNADGSELLYSTYLGGSLPGVLCSPSPCPHDTGVAIAIDLVGNAYVTGFTSSRDYPTTPGAFDTTYLNGSGSTIFLTKLDSNGSELIYSTFLGDSGKGNAIAVAADGSAYVTGNAAVGFPATPGAFDTTGSGNDAFVTKFNADGTGLLYSTFLSGSLSDTGNDIAVDAAGNAYVAGFSDSSDYPTTPGAFDTTVPAAHIGQVFITKLNTDGSALVYSTYLGGTARDSGQAIAVDAAGNAYVTGQTASSNFPTTAGAFDSTFNGGIFDVFVTKLNSTGSALFYSTYVGGIGNENGQGLTVDNSGSVYVTGLSVSNNFPVTPGSFDTTFNGSADSFVIKLSNQPPSAIDDDATTDEDNAVTINVLADDLDPEGDAITLTDVTQGANGSVVINPDQTMMYSPVANFHGTDSFTYTVVDTWGDTDTATVTVTINPVNDPPVTMDDDAIVSEDSGANTINVLANDSDVDGDTPVVTSLTQSAHGTVVNNGTSISYTPNTNYFGPDSLTYTFEDGQGGAGTATVNITVINVNDAPLATVDSYSTNANTTLVITSPGVLGNDADIDGDALSALLVTDVLNGTLLLGTDGSFTYTPNLNFFGTDSFSYRASDGAVGSNTVTVDITVADNLILFSSTRDGNAEIYTVGVNGLSPTRMTNDPATDVFPAWSPDKARIAFNSNREGSFDVYVMNSDGSGPVRLTTGALAEGPVAWSPDGTKIAFSSRRDGNPEIYLMNADGTGLQRLTKQRAIDIKPSWSPDGSRIVFSSDRKRSFEIYVMNVDGTGLAQLTKNGFTDVGAAWSPDGTKIAFSSNRDGNFEIYLMNADGSGQTRLTNNLASDDEPAWFSGGGKIVFTSQRDGNSEIYLMNPDGSGLTRLTVNPAADTSAN